ncbi:hypothetical protein JRQ81_008595 [Phrynocephalus forsythii]|uniref:Uncharacterized protein n=1 Tax=Phrynocephalus forsythii TaxID=171643 RepID=A0A9Q1ASU0_9SAUR|nr:hypothetical protein JRQ81_008595 [Phrynocephalus forsythii]
MAESDWDTVTVLRKKGPSAAQAKSKQLRQKLGLQCVVRGGNQQGVRFQDRFGDSRRGLKFWNMLNGSQETQIRLGQEIRTPIKHQIKYPSKTKDFVIFICICCDLWGQADSKRKKHQREGHHLPASPEYC